MRRLLTVAAVAAAFVAAPTGVAHAAPLCAATVQVDCDYCMDPAGNWAPPHPCAYGQPGFMWVNCTVWVQPYCIVG